jgi:hypothetical protein
MDKRKVISTRRGSCEINDQAIGARTIRRRRGVAAAGTGCLQAGDGAINYGGRQEIIDAIRRIVQDGLAPDQIDDAVLSRYLYTADQPDPDLIVRTSGEMRVSNFLIWQGAYAELYVTPTYWPDFDENELQLALDHYASRERRFGLTGEQTPHSTPSANAK